jgi:hypothetical protein
MEERKDGRNAAQPSRESARKRAYSRPELVVYGPLAKLTRGSTSGVGETSPQGAMRMLCL